MKIAFLTLGCKVNSYETEKMKTQFETEGYEIVSFSEKGRCLCGQYMYRYQYCRP